MRLLVGLALLTLLTACASLEREKYFKLDGDGPNFPGHPKRFPDASAAIGESISVHIGNSALITYLGGILIPFFPVYIFPDMRKDLEDDEKLKVSFYSMNFIDRKEQFERAVFNPPSIILEDGKRLESIGSEKVDGYSKSFIYPIRAKTIDKFIVDSTKVKLPSGKIISTPRLSFRFHSSLEYRLD